MAADPSGIRTTVPERSAASASSQGISARLTLFGAGACIGPRATAANAASDSVKTRIMAPFPRSGLYTESMADWDAARYHRLSDPQVGWGRRVGARLGPAPRGRGLAPG